MSSIDPTTRSELGQPNWRTRKNSHTMPSQQALEDAVRSFLAEENKAQSGDWSFLWDKVADPDRFVFADDLGNVFLGRAEASAEFESWGEYQNYRVRWTLGGRP